MNFINYHQKEPKKYILKLCRYAPKFRGDCYNEAIERDVYFRGFKSNKVYVLPDGADEVDLNIDKLFLNTKNQTLISVDICIKAEE